MNNLTYGQKWAIVAIIASLLITATTFFLDGDVRTFAYIAISMAVAAYAILGRNQSEKPKDG
jgi:hypothetical protein